MHSCNSYGFKTSGGQSYVKKVAKHTHTIYIGERGLTPIFFGPQTLTSWSSVAPWATRMHTISFKSPEQGPIVFTSKRVWQDYIKVFISSQSKPISIVLRVSRFYQA